MCEEAVGVAVSIDIEANELTPVVEAVDSGGANTVGIIDGHPVGIVQGTGQQEAVHHAIASDIGANNLINFVDPKGRRIGGMWEIELGVGIAFEQEPTVLPLEAVRKPVMSP